MTEGDSQPTQVLQTTDVLTLCDGDMMLHMSPALLLSSTALLPGCVLCLLICRGRCAGSCHASCMV